MKSFFRPQRSVRRPNRSAPTTCPIRYTVPVKPTSSDVMPRVSLKPDAETSWISMPSKIQLTPSPSTTIQWNLAQGRRSMRAGTRLRTGRSPAVAAGIRALLLLAFLRHDPSE